VRLVFVHGWGLGPVIWDVLAPKLGDFAQTRVDLGFFGPPALPELRPGDILVGHSAGLLWGLRQSHDWAGVVALNSFSRFTLDDSGRGCVKPAALRAMQKNLARDAQICVNGFRASIGAGPAAGSAQLAPLAAGLELLRDFDAAPVVGVKPWLVVGAADDPLVPPAETKNLAEASGGKLALHASGGHGLPWTAPEYCAERILEFLRAHE
jgi:pimeloyl-[acyl-carrier protein] methyl ester esterase